MPPQSLDVFYICCGFIAPKVCTAAAATHRTIARSRVNSIQLSNAGGGRLRSRTCTVERRHAMA